MHENQFFMPKNKVKNNKNDLCINKCAIVKVTRPSIEIDDVFRVDVSLYVIPKNQYEPDEYEEQVNRMIKHINYVMKMYVLNNTNIFQANSIIDVNFTSANLRRGYNKSVQASMFVKSKNKFDYLRFRDRIRMTIKPTIRMITDKFKEEGFMCHKRKQQVNKKIEKN